MKIIKKLFKVLFWVLALLIILHILFSLIVKPSNDRDWNTDQAVLPEISINEDLVTIKNIRNFTYRTTSEYIPDYYDKTFDLDQIKSVDFMVEPFSTNPVAAHTLLSFGFDDESYVAVSVEIRKEKGETFSAMKGLLRQYELMYVIADERDVIKLRSNYRRDEVFLYPIKTSKENIRALFMGMLARAKELQEKPEFYNTITSTCTTNIVTHVNKLVPDRIPFDFRILTPGYSDKYAYELGLIDTDLSFEGARAKFKINEKAEKHADSLEFSKMIRAVE